MCIRDSAIPGFMGAMTMPYKLKDANILPELHPGDVITADVLVSQDPNADVILDHIVVVAQSKPDYRPTVQYHVPAAGDGVPDLKLRNQDGRAIRLGQFKGQALLVTFIYTRCPCLLYTSDRDGHCDLLADRGSGAHVLRLLGRRGAGHHDDPDGLPDN